MNAHICLLGCSLSTGNRGVTALAVSLIGIILRRLPNARISLLIGEKHRGKKRVWLGKRYVDVDIVNFRLSPRSPFQEHLLWILLLAIVYRFLPYQFLRSLILKGNTWLRTLVEAEFVGDIRGGDSFSDIYGLGRFVVGCIPAIIATLVRGDLVLLPQTFGPYNRRFSRFLAGFIISRAKAVTTRDRRSIPVIMSVMPNCRSKRDVTFCPDVAFTLEPQAPSSPLIVPALMPETYKWIIGFNINGLLYNGGYSRDNMFDLSIEYRHFVHVLVKSLIRELGVNILLIPHTYGPLNSVNSDNHAIVTVSNYLTGICGEKLHILVTEHGPSELKAIIGLCDCFVGSRMHACIAAISQGIPTIGVAYSDKFLGVFDSVGLGEMVFDARKSTLEVLIENIVKQCEIAYNDNTVVSPSLLSVRQRVYEVIDSLFDRRSTA